jgi:LacI family transcriptional regulator
MGAGQGRRSGRVTISDIARRAGTSIATVSHVLHGTKFVRPELAARVRSAVAALDYRPDALARALRTARTRNLGVVLPDLRDHRYTMLLKGCAVAAQASGFSLMIEDAEGSWAREAQCTARLLDKRVDGLAVAPVGTANEALAQAVRQGVPVVLMDGLLEGLPVPAVLPDVEPGVCAAIMHLWEGGHRRIGFVAGTLDTTLRRACFAGYERGLAACGLRVDTALVTSCPPDVVGGAKGVSGLLGLRRPPTALFVAGPSLVLGALRALHERGLCCPEDMALVGLGDTEWAGAATPSLTVVDIPDYDVGRAAVGLLASSRPLGPVAVPGTLAPAPVEPRGPRPGRASAASDPGRGGAATAERVHCGRIVPHGEPIQRLPTRLIVRRSSEGRRPGRTRPAVHARRDADRAAV